MPSGDGSGFNWVRKIKRGPRNRGACGGGRLRTIYSTTEKEQGIEKGEKAEVLHYRRKKRKKQKITGAEENHMQKDEGGKQKRKGLRETKRLLEITHLRKLLKTSPRYKKEWKERGKFAKVKRSWKVRKLFPGSTRATEHKRMNIGRQSEIPKNDNISLKHLRIINISMGKSPAKAGESSFGKGSFLEGDLPNLGD